MILRTLAAGMLLAALLSACSLSTRVPAPMPVDLPTAAPQTIASPSPETPTARAVPPTAAPQASPTTAPTATIELVPNQPATITAEGVNLRQGPGTLFPRLGMMAQDTWVTVIGKAPGDDWLYIKTGSSQGWVSTAFTSLDRSAQLSSVPLQDTGDARIIMGRVVRQDGMPLAGIEFAALHNKNDPNSPATRAHSLADGTFFLYLPASASGVWQVSLTAVDCKSPIVDADCQFQGKFTPQFIDVTLPAEKMLEFRYDQ